MGVVYLVGAGPGDPGLFTVRGREVLERAEVIVADQLARPVLDAATLRAGAEVIVRPAGRSGLAQDEINRLLIERARAGKCVVRLKGGDPFVFGRGGEEAEALVRARVPFVVVPGVTAAVAAPAYAGIPLTYRGEAAAIAFVTGHEAGDKSDGAVDWDALARAAATLVIYMSVTRLGDVVARLLAAGRSPKTPVAVVEHGTLAEQRTIAGTLTDIVERVRAAGVTPPALTVVGEVVRLRELLDWLSPARILLLASRQAEDFGPDVSCVAPLGVTFALDPVREALGRRDARTLALTSVHAVDALFAALAAAGMDARALAGIALTAVGRATAERLAFHGVRADCIGEAGGAQLGAAIAGEGCCEPPVLVLRARGGREELVDTLASRGVAVRAVDAYATEVDPHAIARAVALFRGGVSAVGFASPKGARAFLDALGGPSALGSSLVGAIGATTQEALAEAGVKAEVRPDAPSLRGLVDALRAALAARRKIE